MNAAPLFVSDRNELDVGVADGKQHVAEFLSRESEDVLDTFRFQTVHE